MKPVQLYQAQCFVAPRATSALVFGKICDGMRSRVGLFLGNNPALTSEKEKLGEGGRRRRGGFFGTVAALFLYASFPPNFLPPFLMLILCYFVSNFSSELRAT